MVRRSQSGQKAIRVAAILLSSVLVVGILYWAKVVLIPLALAVLLTFILAPIVTRLDRWGLRRIPAVIVVVTAAGLLLALMTWLLASQFRSLANDLPSYRENIRDKVATIREGGTGGVFEKVRAAVVDATQQTTRNKNADQSADTEAASNLPEPILVRVVSEERADKAFSAVAASVVAISPALGGLATIGVALVLVIFMLVKLEDLRNRLVSFTAQDNLAVTTRALDEAGQRISRYLIIQLIINASFGLAVAIGLLLIGVPYALLWGLCAGIFRYIPYFGPWVAALLPLTVSLITSPDWTQVVLVFGMFLVLELLSNNVMEPWLYGQGIGVAAIALIISATFWTWIWGPIGLILATPLTVCLAVIGKYVPSLAFFDRLLGDRPALEPKAAFLQRVLARDDLEAARIVRQYRAEHGAEKTYDNVLIPALALARKERTRGMMVADEEAFVIEVTRSILEETHLSHESPTSQPKPDTEIGQVNSRKGDAAADFIINGSAASRDVAAEQESGFEDPAPPLIRIIGCAAHQEVEELTLRMLHDLIAPAGLQLDILSTRTLPTEVVDRVAHDRPLVVVIAALPPGGVIQARYLCKILRKRFPEIRIVVGCWMYPGNLDRVIVKFRAAGAHYITTTLQGARDHVLSIAASQTAQNGVDHKPSGSRPPRKDEPLNAERRSAVSRDTMYAPASGESRSPRTKKPK